MQLRLRTMMAEEGSGCPVPRLLWASIQRVALPVFILAGVIAVVYCFLCQRPAQQRQLESPGVSRKGRWRDANLPPAPWSVGTSGRGRLVGAQGEGDSREENAIGQSRAQTERQNAGGKRKKKKIGMRWRRVLLVGEEQRPSRQTGHGFSECLGFGRGRRSGMSVEPGR